MGHYIPSYVYEAFQKTLDKVKVKIWIDGTHYFVRDMRTKPFSAGVVYYKRSLNGWYSAVVRTDDVQYDHEIDSKADIIMGLYYDPDHNPHSSQNGWSEKARVIVIDSCMFGAYKKEWVLDGNVHSKTYPDMGATLWIHYNLDNGEFKAW